MKYLMLMLVGIIMFSACESDSGNKNYRAMNPNLREVKVKEIVQTSSYTYLNFQEEGDTYWAAIPRRDDIEEGGVYYYDHFMEMKDFKSTELDKTFVSVYFIEDISVKPFPSATMKAQTNMASKGTPKIGNQEVEVIAPAEGGITIAELFANKEKYSGKTVKIKGLVVKYTDGVMKRNWIHLQDGTIYGDDFDLTVTSSGTCAINDIIVVEGKIALNQDFGSGYFYDVILEEAVILESEKATSLQ